MMKRKAKVNKQIYTNSKCNENSAFHCDLEFSPDSVRTETALIYDSVILLAEAMKQLGVDNIRPKKLNCFKNEVTWEKGNSISNFMLNVSSINQRAFIYLWILYVWALQSVIDGLSGEIRFDTEGMRTNFALELIELDAHGIVKVGTWSSLHGINLTREIKSEPDLSSGGSFKNKTFIVLTALVSLHRYSAFI